MVWLVFVISVIRLMIVKATSTIFVEEMLIEVFMMGVVEVTI